LKNLGGPFIVTVTPLTNNEELEASERNVEYYPEDEAHGVRVGGSTVKMTQLSKVRVEISSSKAGSPRNPVMPAMIATFNC